MFSGRSDGRLSVCCPSICRSFSTYSARRDNRDFKTKLSTIFITRVGIAKVVLRSEMKFKFKLNRLTLTHKLISGKKLSQCRERAFKRKRFQFRGVHPRGN